MINGGKWEYKVICSEWKLGYIESPLVKTYDFDLSFFGFLHYGVLSFPYTMRYFIIG